MFRILFALIYCVAFFSMPACKSTRRGHIINEDALSQIKIGVSNKEDVVRLMGLPTFANDKQVRFFYAEQKGIRFLFIRNIPKYQKIVEIGFDSNQIVSLIKFYHLSDFANSKSRQMNTYEDHMKLFRPQ